MRGEQLIADNSYNSLRVNKNCYHCHLPIESESQRIEHKDKSFCCSGCLTVYQILSKEGLDHYYQIKDDNMQGASLSNYDESLSFNYLDHPKFQEDYANIDKERKTMSFFLEDVHCLACLWLIEKGKDQVSGVKQVSLNMTNSTVKVVIDNKSNFAPIASYFNRLGYQPHPIKSDYQVGELKKKENKKQLTRLGFAAFCSGNIMLLAISLYAGAESEYKTIFSWLSGIFYLPLATYCSIPFYRSGLKALENKQNSIDLPISLILIIGGIASYVSLFQGGEQFYFDSLGTFIFLILGTRYILEQIQKKNLSFKGVSSFFSSEFVQRKTDSEEVYQQVSIHSLKKGDFIRLEAGDVLPVDAKLNQNYASINNSFLTGEHMPVSLKRGDEVSAGCSLIGEAAEFRVIETLVNSRLQQILSQIQNNWMTKKEFVGAVDKAASKLLLISMFLASLIILFFLASGDFVTGLHRALAILIITCPCALALGTPLSLINGLRSLFKAKILARNSHSILKLANASHIFFDKTGTLTEGNFKVIKWEGQKDLECLSAIYALESYSHHPIASSLKNYIQKQDIKINNLIVRDFQEKLGKGISGEINNQLWEVRKDQSWRDYGNAIQVLRDGQNIAQIILQDQIKDSSHQVAKQLQDQGFKVFILSGDNERTTTTVASLLNIPRSQVIANSSPEMKKEVLKQYPNSIMVGDGLNDILALDSAAVGITLGGKIDLNLESSDIYLPDKRIESIFELVRFSKKINKIVRRNIVISLSYNSLGILAAFFGLIGPLGAAILMPISSLSVILSSFLGSQYGGQK